MKNQPISVTKSDYEKLHKLIEMHLIHSPKLSEPLQGLDRELQRAKILDSEEIPANVITLNSTARLRDENTGDEMELQLVLPQDADIDSGKISVLAPLGTAMLGYRTGNVFEWQVPAGVRKIKVTEVIYQPEQARRRNGEG